MQSTIAVSKLVTNLLGQSDSNLRKSLSTIATFVSQDEKVKVCAEIYFPRFSEGIGEGVISEE